MSRAYIVSSDVREATSIQARVRRSPNPPSPIPGVIVTSNPQDLAHLPGDATVYVSRCTPAVSLYLRQREELTGTRVHTAYELLRDCGAYQTEDRQ